MEDSIRAMMKEEENIRCGEPIQKEVFISDASACDPKIAAGEEGGCFRSYWVYYPPSYCEDHEEGKPMYHSTVMLLHCFGCTGLQMLREWQQELAAFVLVAPEGYSRSWNAKECCGYALNNNIDDVTYLSLLKTHLSSSIPTRNTYAIGFSNGGFLATYASHLFQAIAPYSGHVSTVDTSTAKTSLFLHHALDDQHVLDAGCCSSQEKQCCCEISKHTETCRSTQDIFQLWSHSDHDASTDSTETQVTFQNEQLGIVCQTAIQVTQSHPRNVTYCQYAHGGHRISQSLLKYEFATFFQRDACQHNNNNGIYNDHHHTCTCPDGTVLTSPSFHCHQQQQQLTSSNFRNNPDLRMPIDDHAYTFLQYSSIICLLSALSIYACYKTQSKFSNLCCRRKTWIAVPTNENENNAYDLSYRHHTITSTATIQNSTFNEDGNNNSHHNNISGDIELRQRSSM